VLEDHPVPSPSQGKDIIIQDVGGEMQDGIVRQIGRGGIPVQVAPSSRVMARYGGTEGLIVLTEVPIQPIGLGFVFGRWFQPGPEVASPLSGRLRV